MTTVTLVTVGDSVRARLGPWPYEPDVVQIVLLDHHMIPRRPAVLEWIRRARAVEPRAIRTGAMFPEAAEAFLDVGFRTIDTLALLETSLIRERRLLPSGTERLRPAHFDEIALLDRAAFGDPWGNDAISLGDITEATPRHRGRIVRAPNSTAIAGFAISGQSGQTGYLQRLAVHPAARRTGVAQRLLDDGLRWMARRGAQHAMVNTALDNDAALGLYLGAGFARRPEQLKILELSGDALADFGS